MPPSLRHPRLPPPPARCGLNAHSLRGGGILANLVENDILEAVIGLPQNLFYGTGIPACMLVMRPKGAKSVERQGKVLFINADAEY